MIVIDIGDTKKFIQIRQLTTANECRTCEGTTLWLQQSVDKQHPKRLEKTR